MCLMIHQIIPHPKIAQWQLREAIPISIGQLVVCTNPGIGLKQDRCVVVSTSTFKAVVLLAAHASISSIWLDNTMGHRQIGNIFFTLHSGYSPPVPQVPAESNWQQKHSLKGHFVNRWRPEWKLNISYMGIFMCRRPSSKILDRFELYHGTITFRPGPNKTYRQRYSFQNLSRCSPFYNRVPGPDKF